MYHYCSLSESQISFLFALRLAISKTFAPFFIFPLATPLNFNLFQIIQNCKFQNFEKQLSYGLSEGTAVKSLAVEGS